MGILYKIYSNMCIQKVKKRMLEIPVGPYAICSIFPLTGAAVDLTGEDTPQ